MFQCALGVACCNRRALIRTISSINEPLVWHAQPHGERHSRALWCGAPVQDRRSGGSGYVASMVSLRDGVAQLFVVPPVRLEPPRSIDVRDAAELR